MSADIDRFGRRHIGYPTADQTADSCQPILIASDGATVPHDHLSCLKVLCQPILIASDGATLHRVARKLSLKVSADIDRFGRRHRDRECQERRPAVCQPILIASDGATKGSVLCCTPWL